MFNILAIYTDGNDIYVAGGQTIDNEWETVVFDYMWGFIFEF